MVNPDLLLDSLIEWKQKVPSLPVSFASTARQDTLPKATILSLDDGDMQPLTTLFNETPPCPPVYVFLFPNHSYVIKLTFVNQFLHVTLQLIVSKRPYRLKSAVQFEQVFELFSMSLNRFINEEVHSFAPRFFFPYLHITSIKKLMHKSFVEFIGDGIQCSIGLSKTQDDALFFDISFPFSIPTSTRESSKSLRCNVEAIVDISKTPLIVVMLRY